MVGQKGALLGAAQPWEQPWTSQVTHQSLPQCPWLVFFCPSGSHSAAWGCCSSQAGTLDIPTDPGDINLLMQVVLRDALC